MDLDKLEEEQKKLGLTPETIEELRKVLDQSVQQQTNLGYAELVDMVTDKKATNATHEILFDIKATVLEENEKGEIVSTKEIMTKKFHIPVPIDKEYNKFMGVFFDHLEKSILDSTNKAYETGDEENS